jgi:hypothetical protein
MSSALEFLLGLLEARALACAAWEDFQGPHAQALLLWQGMGFVDRDPGQNPVPGCPYCAEGVPYRLGERFLCNRCFSTVDYRHLLLWMVNLRAFLRWLAAQLRLRGGIRRIDERLWQLGTWEEGEIVSECFYHERGPFSDIAKNRLAAYRSAVVFYGLFRPMEAEHGQFTCISLLEILRLGRSFGVIDRRQLLRRGGDVIFDPQSGVVRAGNVWLGEVPVGSKEYFLLVCLWRQRDRFVAYADLKRFVLQHSAGQDETEEATFCQKLKSRIKAKRWIPLIDVLIATTNKADGYRLRGYVEL